MWIHWRIIQRGERIGDEVLVDLVGEWLGMWFLCFAALSVYEREHHRSKTNMGKWLNPAGDHLAKNTERSIYTGPVSGGSDKRERLLTSEIMAG